YGNSVKAGCCCDQPGHDHAKNLRGGHSLQFLLRDISGWRTISLAVLFLKGDRGKPTPEPGGIPPRTWRWLCNDDSRCLRRYYPDQVHGFQRMISAVPSDTAPRQECR